MNLHSDTDSEVHHVLCTTRKLSLLLSTLFMGKAIGEAGSGNAPESGRMLWCTKGHDYGRLENRECLPAHLLLAHIRTHSLHYFCSSILLPDHRFTSLLNRFALFCLLSLFHIHRARLLQHIKPKLISQHRYPRRPRRSDRKRPPKRSEPIPLQKRRLH